ncbi:MAG: MFS transporter [Bryobacteraceae bacterium]
MTNLSSSRVWTIVGLLSVAGFINYLDRAVLSVALPVVSRDLHLDPTAKGVLLSSFFWSYALLQVPMGWCSDRFNLRWFYAGMFALWSVACGLTGFASTLAALLWLRVLLGIGESVYLPGGMKIVSLLFKPDSRGLAAGLVNCGTRFGLALGAPLTAWLVTSRGWRSAFFIVGFASLVWLVPWLRACPSAKPDAAPLRQAGRRAWRDRNLAGICLAHIGFSYYWYLFVTWLPDYLVVERHMPLQKAGAFAFLPYLVFSVCEPLGGWAADLLIRAGWNESRARKGVITFAFLTSLALLPAGRLANDAAAIGLIAAAAMVGLATGNILALLQQFAPHDDVGMWTGILNFVGNLSGILAPLVTGILISRTSSYAPGFVVAVVILLAGLPAYWLMVGGARAAEKTTHA